MKHLLVPAVIALSATLVACSGGSSQDEPPVVVPPSTPDTPAKRIAITISPSLASRANDYGFDEGDRIGVYVVNNSAPSTPGVLSQSGNHVDNMRFTYSGSWTPDTPIYWKDDDTHADFYLYYPYVAGPSVSAMPFTVKADQSAEASYRESDMLWGKTSDVTPTASAISIPMGHVMSRMVVKVQAGNGFTAASLAASAVSVRINGVQCSSTVNLATGTPTPSGERVSVTPLHSSDSYIALIVPQTVPEGNLITINVDGKDYNLNRSFTFERGKSHTFNVTVSKTSQGVNVNISPWDNDREDHGGTAE